MELFSYFLTFSQEFLGGWWWPILVFHVWIFCWGGYTISRNGGWQKSRFLWSLVMAAIISLVIVFIVLKVSSANYSDLVTVVDWLIFVGLWMILTCFFTWYTYVYFMWKNVRDILKFASRK